MKNKATVVALLLTSFFIFSTNSIFGQIGPTYFNNSIGDDHFHHVIQTEDERIFAVGSKSTLQDRYGVWFVELSETGEILNEVIFPIRSDSKGEMGHRIVILGPDKFMILGKSFLDDSPWNESTGIAININYDGTENWKRYYADIVELNDAVELDQGGFMLVGYSSSIGVILNINDSGILQWKKFHSISSGTFIKRIFKTSDENLLLVGRSHTTGVGFEGVFMIKINLDGNEIWKNYYHTDSGEDDILNLFATPLGVLQLANDEIIIVNPGDHQSDVFLMHFDDEGNIKSRFVFGHTQREYPTDVNLLENGNYLITGYSENGLERYGFAMEATPKGKEVWKRYYGEPLLNEYFLSGICLSSGNLLLTGFGNSGQNTSLDGLIYTTEKNGNPYSYTLTGKVLYDVNNNCIADAEDIPASQIFLNLEGHLEPMTISDSEGNFEYRVYDGNYDLSPIVSTTNWEVCNISISAVLNENNPIESATFLIKQKNPCISPEVHVTQPDFNICEKSKFFVTVKNPSLSQTVPQVLSVEIDPELEIISYSGMTSQTGNNLEFQVNEIEPLQNKTFEIIVKTSCDVLIGATHGLTAKMQRADCLPPLNSSQLTIESSCDGTNTIFTIKNIGTEDMRTNSEYRTFEDEFDIGGGTINLKAQEIAEITFPADGLTRRVEIEQGGGTPISAVQEACGISNNGLYSVGYRNAWSRNDSEPHVAHSYHPNTTGQPNKISEAISGFGYRQNIDDISKIEFTARAVNPLDHIVEEVEFRLDFNENFDVSTFNVLSSNVTPEVFVDQNQTVIIKMTEVDISSSNIDNTNDDAFVRFSIKPVNGVFPDQGASSLLEVTGKAIFDDEVTVNLQRGWLNYIRSAIEPLDSTWVYPEEICLFGGRGLDFGFEFAKNHFGSVYFSGGTDSYSGLDNRDAYIVKMKPNGKAHWKKVYSIEVGADERFRAISPLPDGGLMVAGAILPADAPSAGIRSYQALIGRIDPQGNLLWHKIFSPGTGFAGYISDMTPTNDGNFLVSGYAENDWLDNFLAKISPEGNIIWTKNYPDSRVEAEQVFETSDGGLLVVGSLDDVDIFMQKTDSEGNTLWTKNFIEPKSISGGKAILNEDQSILYCAEARWRDSTDNSVTTPYFAKFDADGNNLFTKTPILGPYNIAGTRNIIRDPNGGYFAVGDIYADTVNYNRNGLLLKIDEDAEIIWHKNYGSRKSEDINDAIVTNENQLLLLGFNQPQLTAANLQAFVVKTDLEGSPYVNVNEKSEVQKTPFAISYPNPTVSQVTIELKNRGLKSGQWKLFDLSGKKVRSERFSKNKFQISLEGLSQGVYFLRFQGENLPILKLIKVD